MANDASSSPPMFPPVPGFEFLQSLVKKNAGVGMPGLGQWVAPTLDPEEVEKRIAELKAVQFWLEQNARMLAATIQALEVQRMTLSTLKTMNVRMTDLRDALTLRPPEGGEAPKSAPAPAPADPTKPRNRFPMPSMTPPAVREAAKAAEPAPAPPQPQPPSEAPAAGGAEPAVDAMQWWSALTQQFADLATGAMRDGAEATQKLAGMMPGGTGGGMMPGGMGGGMGALGGMGLFDGTGDPAQAEAAAAAQATGQGAAAAPADAPPASPAAGERRK